MGLIAKKTGMDIKPIPEGVYQAVCYSVVDLGTHLDPKWEKEIHKVQITWELPEERIEVEREGEKVNLPRAISKKYTLSLSDRANLRHDLEAWRGKKFTEKELDGFELANLLGANCQIQIVHCLSADQTKTYANIGSIMALPKKMEKCTPENATICFSLADVKPGDKLPEVPEWLQEIIADSNEWKALQDEPKELVTAGDSTDLTGEPLKDEEIPF